MRTFRINDSHPQYRQRVSLLQLLRCVPGARQPDRHAHPALLVVCRSQTPANRTNLSFGQSQPKTKTWAVTADALERLKNTLKPLRWYARPLINDVQPIPFGFGL